MSRTGPLWNALIKTHHITSRKKVSKLKQAAGDNDVSVLLRSGSSPGIMYVEGTQAGVDAWVGVVQRLRYKDYQLAARPGLLSCENARSTQQPFEPRFSETDSVKDFAVKMEQRELLSWWRRAMGYERPIEGA